MQKDREMKIATIYLITILALTCSGCAPQTLTDTGISIRIKNGPATDSETSDIQIGVETVDRIVTLSGVIPTERERAKAEQIARNTEGVKDVANNITVNPETTGATNIEKKAEEASTTDL
jgi:osmotically-inducible protein OsmY